MTVTTHSKQAGMSHACDLHPSSSLAPPPPPPHTHTHTCYCPVCSLAGFPQLVRNKARTPTTNFVPDYQTVLQC